SRTDNATRVRDDTRRPICRKTCSRSTEPVSHDRERSHCGTRQRCRRSDPTHVTHVAFGQPLTARELDLLDARAWPPLEELSLSRRHKATRCFHSANEVPIRLQRRSIGRRVNVPSTAGAEGEGIRPAR